MNDQSINDTGFRRDLAIAVAVAFVLRGLFLVAVHRVIDMADAIHYIAMAQQFAAGDFLGFDENLPVLYSALGALAHGVLPDWEWAFWAVSLAASSLVVVPVYLLSRELHGRDAARIAALLVCLWPWLVDYAGRIVPESLALLLWFASIWLLYVAIERGGLAIFAAPLTLFALHLTRPEGSIIMVAAPLGALVLCAKRERVYYRRYVVFTALCVVLLVAYAVAMRYAVGTFTVTYRAPMASDLLDYFGRSTFDMARTFLQLLGNALPIMLGPFLLMFLGVGLFFPSEGPRRIRLESLVLFFCAVQCAVTLANLSPAPRYIMTVVVALSLWSARGMAILTRQAADLAYGRWLKTLPIGIVVMTFVLGTAASLVSEYGGTMPGLPREYKIAGRWMMHNLEPGLILCRKPQVGYYAGMPTTGPAADDGPEEAVARAKDIGARYLVVDERYTVSMIPGLRPLLDPGQAPPELKLLNADLSPWTGARIVIYQVVAPGIRYLREDEFPEPSSHMGPDAVRRKTAIPKG